MDWTNAQIQALVRASAPWTCRRSLAWKYEAHTVEKEGSERTGTVCVFVDIGKHCWKVFPETNEVIQW